MEHRLLIRLAESNFTLTEETIRRSSAFREKPRLIGLDRISFDDGLKTLQEACDEAHLFIELARHGAAVARDPAPGRRRDPPRDQPRE